MSIWSRRVRCLETDFFFFNDTATTEIYTLSLHDALPILCSPSGDFLALLSSVGVIFPSSSMRWITKLRRLRADRKSTRLNSSHGYISYAVFCLEKKNMIKDASQFGEQRAHWDGADLNIDA